MFNAEKFCFDHQIPIAPRGHQHNRHGWVNVSCPYCQGGSGYHLGINIVDAYSSCYRCGHHWIVKTISLLARTTIQQAFVLIKQYSSGSILQEYNKIIQRKDKLEFPAGVGRMQKMHFDYLKGRNFNASITREWELMGSGIHGEQAFRIVAPIRLDGSLISYQGRDITDKSPMKYKNCPDEEQVFPHKAMIYGIDKCGKNKKILIVEGVFDVWKIGPGCGSTLGIEWTQAQARMIANRFNEFVLLYDTEEQAQEKALLLYNYLTVRGLSGEIATINIGKDPGGLTQKQAKEIRGDFGL